MATAKATWTVLEEYAQEKRWVLARQPVDWEKVKAEMSTIWPRLKRDLEEFQIARTKTEKLEWFSSRGFDESSILPYVKRVSLRDGRRPISQVNIPSVSSPSVPPISLAAVPQDVVAFLTAFFSSWVGTTDFAGLAGKFVAASNLAKNLGLQGRPDEIAVTMLALWRVADHGEVERLGGHLPPKPGTQAASELQAILNDRKSFVVTDGIAYAMIPLGVKGPPLALAPMGGNKYAAMGRFRHAPHDVVMAVAEQVDGNWKITEIRSVVDH